MKTILAFREEAFAWSHEVFPCVHPLLLPLCNKPFIEYLIDLAILTGSTAVRILCDGGLGPVERYCEDGSRWGIALSYESLHADDTVPILLGKNRRFCGSERIMVVSGFSFIRYDKRLDYKSLAGSRPEGEWVSSPGGSITLSGPPEQPRTDGTNPPLSLMPLDGLATYYRASMEALETGADRYVLPGYGGEPGCSIGRNVVISKSVQIRKPVSIGNNVQLLGDTIIGPSAIIGSNVIIDRESSVESSIVLDNTYIGEHLEVNGRIASGNRLNDPVSGASISMEDPHLLGSIKKSRALSALPRKIAHALAALVMIAVLSIPFLLLAPLLRFGGRWKSARIECLSENPDDTIPLGKVELDTVNAPGAIAAALSLDRYIWLFRVLTGQLALIGSTPLPADANQPNSPANALAYRPGVFSYAEAEEWPATGGDAAIVERFHLTHGSTLADIGLSIKAFINRLQEKSTV
ncbi:nucleoside-diphosphate-sugar pyrophosphorylase [Chlorobaculum limnaeum]|uniref:Nucleoside-diphosphate-sugar pyrophosphorylase n=1 Tax=Chlorobaculum limnaeum TaxID=274537 RepID=A0A1D8D653_CHLLM|nr:nucleoside-diphosphate-sugar pyrophosphorylase [Chlorobaculum limnaeum]AOS84174.1 nucleoside-diphosphate-sugar pyrophosphorylase [Chlorobaculum limnaeum]